MPLSSMTGFARADGAGEGHRWTWELRSVNGKGLDVRLRLSPGFEFLEGSVRERIGAALVRGNTQASLSVQAEAGGVHVRVNETVLSEVIQAMERIGERVEIQPPTMDGLLAVRGVVETVEPFADEEGRNAVGRHMIASLDAAIASLVADRRREGRAIGTVLETRLADIARLTRAAEATPARAPEAIRARLAEQVATLLDAAPALDPDRLHQEAVLLATRADIREEIDRLDAHVAAARALLAENGAVGRRLDFLAQEFNREVNTLCSKSNDVALTAIGLELKATVDQFREQVQNLE
ncbi:MAG TPA: YicC/YloC family endoribonuclease [Bauldia sp.]|nr:YicC/YloC family endoribonuclease [Bauldia sp.]